MTNQQKTNWKVQDKRFVGFIDILGFKDKISRLSHVEIYAELSKISAVRSQIEKIIESLDKENIYYDCDIHIVNFSDSIVVFSKNDSFQNFEYFLGAIRFLFANCIKDGISLKGGIAYGEISLNKEQQIYFGQAIIDAYFIEEELNYLGIAAHNSIDRYLHTNEKFCAQSDKIWRLLTLAKTPLKTGKIMHYNIDWFLMTVVSKEEEKDKKIRRVLEMFYLNVSGSARKYIDNTLEFYDEQLINKNINFITIE